MGISVSFSNNTASAEATHFTYSTCAAVLEAAGLPTKQLERDYYISFPVRKALPALEALASRLKRQASDFVYGDPEGIAEILENDRIYVFTRQILAQYNEARRKGLKPTRFSGA